MGFNSGFKGLTSDSKRYLSMPTGIKYFCMREHEFNCRRKVTQEYYLPVPKPTLEND